MCSVCGYKVSGTLAAVNEIKIHQDKKHNKNGWIVHYDEQLERKVYEDNGF